MESTYFENRKPESLKAWLVAALCLAEVAAVSYLLYQDVNEKGGAGHGKPMARIERSESKVRRKAGSSYVWTAAQPNEDLYRKDSVQTGPASAATVRFNDGTALEIAENSLVVIDDIANLALNTTQGSVILKRANGTDSKITVGKDGKAKVEEIPVRLTQPEPLARYFVPEGKSREISFAWEQRRSREQAQAPGENILQISQERAFRKERTRSYKVEGGEARSFKTELQPGLYFWRISGKDSLLSSTGQFRIQAAVPLSPVYPSGSDKIQSWGGESSSLQFRWSASRHGAAAEDEGSAASGEHVLEVARDAAFKDLVATSKVSPESGVATLKAIPDGAMYWRIRSSYADVPVSSAALPFRVERRQKLAIELGSPAEQAAIEYQPKLRFNWNCDSPDVEFSWEVQGADGKTVASARSKTQAFLWENPPAGAYKWRVTALLSGQNVGESPWRKVSVFKGSPVALKAPAAGQEIRFWDEAKPFDFRWESDSLAQQEGASYRLEIAADADFKNLLQSESTRETTLPSARFKLKDGTFFWRVRVVDGAGQPLKSSEAFKFTYGVYPTLRAPASASAAAPVFNVVDDDKDPAVSWEKVEGAEAYEVTLYANGEESPGRQPSSSGKVVKQFTTEKPGAEFKGLAAGNYSFSVRPIDRLKRKGEPTAPKGFTITYGEPLETPEAVTPEVQ